MQIQNQRRIKIHAIQDDILNLSQTLGQLNIEVNTLLELEGNINSNSDIHASPPEQLKVVNHVIPTTEPNKAVEGVIGSFLEYIYIQFTAHIHF